MTTSPRSRGPAVTMIARLGRQIATRGVSRLGVGATSLALAGQGALLGLAPTGRRSGRGPDEGSVSGVKVHRWTVRVGDRRRRAGGQETSDPHA